VRLSLSSLGRTFGGLGTLLLVIDFVLENQYAKTRPRVAEAHSGRIYPLNVHGIVYVTSREQFHLHVLSIGAAICMVLFALVVCLEIRRRKREGGIGKNLRSPH
jgi:hypothetical protein